MNSVILRRLRQILVLTLGGTVLFIGVLLIFLPGPSFLVIPAGLAILALEFAWAKTLLKKVQLKAGSRFSRWLPRKWRAENLQDSLPNDNPGSKKS